MSLAPAGAPSDLRGADPYEAVGLPSGLVLNAETGRIGGTPSAAGEDVTAVVTSTDAAGNTGTVTIDFPAVAKGTQTIAGFGYGASAVATSGPAPALNAGTAVTVPVGTPGALGYATDAPAVVCSVDGTSGALTLGGKAGTRYVGTANSF